MFFRTIPLVALSAIAATSSYAAGATGFYRVENRGGDSWQVVDPAGNDTFILGVDHVTYHGHWCEKLGRHPHLDEMKKKFPDKEDWKRDTAARLKSWGFNMLGAGSDESLKEHGLLYTVCLSAGDKWAFDKDENKWICPNEHRPCSAFPNVFHPDWEKHCNEVAAKVCAPCKDDQRLFGYFIDNELAWWGRSRQWGTSAEGLFDEAIKKKDGHSAKAAALALLAERGVSPAGPVPAEVKQEFLRRAAELYFAKACAAIRRADPNHLVLGARFAGTGGAHPVVWQTAGKYCDMVTFNCYPWADIDRDIVFSDIWGRSKPVYDTFKKTYDMVKRPLMITEWSFPALDSGLPCLNGAGQRFRTQRERTHATALFAKSMLAMPFIAGYDYFMWVDEPALGISSAFPEDSNYGLINNKGEAYPEITDMFRRLHANLAYWRRGCIETRADGSYRIAGPGGISMEGRTGGSAVFEKVSLGGELYGTFNVMLALKTEKGTAWCDASKVVSVERKGYALEVVAEGDAGGSKFQALLRFSSPAENGKVSVEALSVRNTSAEKLVVDKIIFREYPQFAGGAGVRKNVRNLWKGDKTAAWTSKDGREYGGSASSAQCVYFRYWKDRHGFHPDAMFAPSRTPAEIAPGGVLNLSGVWMDIILR